MARVLANSKGILLLVSALCLAGGYSAVTMPSAVFPHTDFPRVVILIDSGAMPADEMMATITRPVEEAMKDIPGTVNIRSSTSRGSAVVNVFFDWKTDMIQSELYVLGRVSQIRNALPAHAQIRVYRLTFSAFPALGISLTSAQRNITDLWETARYDILPRFLRIRGVARVNLVGGRVPEWHVVVDPQKLEAHHLTLDQICKALAATNQITPVGMHEENHQLYLAIVNNRLQDASEIEDVVVAWVNQAPVRVRDVGLVRRGAAPQFNRVTADGQDAVLLNVYGQPDCNVVQIEADLRKELARLRDDLPPDMKLAFFYDQSQFVREGLASVWESIIFGLMLSVLVLYVFLRSVSATLVAASAIPITVLLTLVGLRLAGMSFNLMTLGGIAAAVGIVIDDAIVIVEAMYANIEAGHSSYDAAILGMREVGPALVGSTLTPVVVFVPLTFLEGIAGVFFRALAVTMVMALLTSLLLAVTWTPVAGWLLMRRHATSHRQRWEEGGPLVRRWNALFAWVLGRALRYYPVVLLLMLAVLGGGVWLYGQLETGFLPDQDEGGFVLDYFSRPGTSLSETDRMLRHVEQIIASTPEVESYSRRTGARLALALAEPNFGDFLVKLKQKRTRSTAEVINDLRHKINALEPALHLSFAGILGDLVTDLTWSPAPVEIKLFSSNLDQLKRIAPQVAQTISQIPGIVDVNDGLIVAGPSLQFRVKTDVAARTGLNPQLVGAELQTAMFGTPSSYLLSGDRLYPVRVVGAPDQYAREDQIAHLPIRSPTGAVATVSDLASIEHEAGVLQNHREDQRQLIYVTSRLENVDLGTAISAIRAQVDPLVAAIPGVTVEYGGLYEQQQQSFRNLAFVLVMAVLLVYGVLVFEFQALLQPLAIVAGSILALFGVECALWATGTALNIVSFLGAIIGVGITAKNGILMLDFVEHLRAGGLSLADALIQSGRRRLRPVLMTSLTTFLGLLPLAYGVGAGADMLRPMAIAVIGSLLMSLALSLIATPVLYYLLLRLLRADITPRSAPPAVEGSPIP
jgi:CzcA family heavy metal efflux pump